MRHVFEVRSLLQDPGDAALAVARQVYAPGRTPCPLIPETWQDAGRLVALRAFLGNALLPAVGAAGSWGDSTHYPIVTVDPQGRVTKVATQAVSTTVDNGICQGRLTLTSGTPVTTSDVIGATTIYWSPCNGNSIALWNGSAWIVDTFSEISLALGTLTSGLPYDVYAHDSSGSVALEKLAWTNTLTRATAITLTDGVYTKNGDKTRRYLGTFYTTSTTTTEDGVNNRYVWNYYNRRARPMYWSDSAASWTYNTPAWRQANANAAAQLNAVVGVAEDAVHVTYAMNLFTGGGAGTVVNLGIGRDTAGPLATCVGTLLLQVVSTYSFANVAVADNGFTAGKHSWLAVEYAQGNAAATMVNSAGVGTSNGLTGIVWG